LKITIRKPVKNFFRFYRNLICKLYLFFAAIYKKT